MKNEKLNYNLENDFLEIKRNTEYFINYLIKELYYYQQVYHAMIKTAPCSLFKKKYKKWEDNLNDLKIKITKTEKIINNIIDC